MDGQPYQTSNAQQLRVVRQLLWDVISLHLYPAERDEIRRALGGLLLDESEALFAEAGALADILGDVQLNTAALLSRHQLCSNPHRSMVESEIRLLIDRLHASANATPYGSAAVRDRDPDSLLPRSGRRDKEVLEYVATVAQIAETGGRPPSSAGLPPRPPTSLSASSRPGTSSRPPTALSASASITLPSPLSRPGTASPTLLGSRPSTASSATSSAATRYTDAPSVVAGVADKLSVATIEAVRDTLRAALQDERAALLEDIEYLQGLLEAEADLQVRAAAPPPSLAELKDYSSRLATVVANEEARVEHEVRVSAMFAAADQQPSRAGRLRGMVDASRRPASAGAGAAATFREAAQPPPASPPQARGASASGCSGGASGAQTLVVHGDDGEAAVRHSQELEPGPAARAAAVPAELSPSARQALGASSAAVAARSAPLAPVRRPGSGGSGPTAPSLDSSQLPPVLPLRPSATRLDGRHAPGTESASPAASQRAAPAAAECNGLTGANAASPLALGSHPASAMTGRLRQGSPARLLQPAPGSGQGASSSARGHSLLAAGPAATAALGQAPSPPVPPHRDRSPSLAAVSGSPARSPAGSATAQAGLGVRSAGLRSGSTGGPVAGSATAVPVASTSAGMGSAGLRPALPRSGSVGARTASAERRHGGGSVSGTASAASGGGGATATVTLGRTTGTSGSRASAAAASASPGSAVAARLGTAAAGLPASGDGVSADAQTPPTAVQPRALMGNKKSVVEQLESEVDAVKGGVAAILERYNIRPTATPAGETAAAAAGGGAAGGAAGKATVGVQRAAAR